MSPRPPQLDSIRPRWGLYLLAVLGLLSSCDLFRGQPYCYEASDCAAGAVCVKGACVDSTDAGTQQSPEPPPTEPSKEPVAAEPRRETPTEPRPEPASVVDEPGPADEPAALDASEPVAEEPGPEPSKDATHEAPTEPRDPCSSNPTYAKDKGWIRYIDGDNRLSGAGFDRSFSPVIDPCGRVFVTGGLLPTPTPTTSLLQNKMTKGAAYLALVDRSGALAWHWIHSMHSANQDSRSAIHTMTSYGGDLYLFGYANPSLTFPTGSGNTQRLPSQHSSQFTRGFDMFLVKHKASVSKQPSFRELMSFGSLLDDKSEALGIDQSGALHINGTFRGATLSLPGGLKLNRSAKGVGNPFYAYGNKGKFTHGRVLTGLPFTQLIHGPTGELYAIGRTEKSLAIDSCKIPLLSHQSAHFFFLRFERDPKSTKVVCKEILLSGASTERGQIQHLLPLSKHTFVLFGYFYVSIQFPNHPLLKPPATAPNTRSYFLMKYDIQQKKVLWLTQATGKVTFSMADLIADAAGNLYGSGQFHHDLNFENGALVVKNPKRETLGYVAKWDAQGKIQWFLPVDRINTPATPGATSVHGLAISPLGHLYATGYTHSTARFPIAWKGATPLYAHGAENGAKTATGKSAGFLWKVPNR